MHFLTEYIKAPRRIGAVAPSSVHLARQMTAPISFEKARLIVEYGPGTGVFTRELLRRRQPGTTLVLIEQNEHFCQALRQAFAGEKDLHIISGSAADVKTHLAALGHEAADYIVSGLPFSSLPRQVSDAILEATKLALAERGRFITFQYTLWKKAYLERFFAITGCRRELKNLPPAYVLVMEKWPAL